MSVFEEKPCQFTTIDTETGREKSVAPNVMCMQNCERCGFNPTVLKQRFQEGLFMSAKSRVCLLTGTLEDLPPGTKRLVFPRRPHGD